MVFDNLRAIECYVVFSNNDGNSAHQDLSLNKMILNVKLTLITDTQ